MNAPAVAGRQNARSQPEVFRIPRMRRLGYLQALLDAIGEGGCTKSEARESIIQAVRELDANKAAALGRQQPKVPKADALTEQCIQMSTRLGLVERRRDHLTMTPVGATLNSSDQEQSRCTLFRLIWSVFPNFRAVVRAVCERADGFHVPVNRYHGLFDKAIGQQGLMIDQITFEIARDLATELLILNWRPVFQDDGEHQHVYPIGASTTQAANEVARVPEEQAETWSLHCIEGCAASYSAPISQSEEWIFTGNLVNGDHFESTLWKQYLQLTDRVPRFPVLYPELRDAVCEALRISDSCFEHLIRQLLRYPKRLAIFPAEGVLDFSAKTAIAYKQVPPRTTSGQFMTFLKIDRRMASDGA